MKYKFWFSLKIINQLIEYYIFPIASHVIKIMLYFTYEIENKMRQFRDYGREKTCLRSSLFRLSNIQLFFFATSKY